MRYWILGVLLVLLAGCGSGSSTTAGQNTVTGLAVRHATGLPVAAAEIRLREIGADNFPKPNGVTRNVLTDSTGHFTFKNLPNGKYDLSSTTPGPGPAALQYADTITVSGSDISLDARFYDVLITTQ